MEKAISSRQGLGFQISSDSAIRKDFYLFGEAQGRIVITIKPENIKKLEEMLSDMGIEYQILGAVTATGYTIDGEDFGKEEERLETTEKAAFPVGKAALNETVSNTGLRESALGRWS